MSIPNIVWITWEKQRRSVTLAECLGARLFVLLDQSDRIPSRPLRYAYLLAKTVLVLVRERPSVCCCQNPSLMLAVWLGLLRPLFRYRLVVDRHSNFNLQRHAGLKWQVFDFLSDLSLRHADLTIVTNEFLAEYVRRAGGRAFVLQDKVPSLTEGGTKDLGGARNIVFVCSFDEDEPVEAAIEAARGLDPSWQMFVTGNYRRHLRRLPVLQAPPATVKLTGFLGDAEYQTLLRSADVVMALTTHDHTLMCVAYEATALGKPVVASDTAAMREYFHKGFVFTDNSAASIREAISKAVREAPQLSADVGSLRSELHTDWHRRFAELLQLLRGLVEDRHDLPGHPAKGVMAKEK
jgi:glycosyltransferase involved in cell wall biosynthesis